jgi:hypothetical protein
MYIFLYIYIHIYRCGACTGGGCVFFLIFLSFWLGAGLAPRGGGALFFIIFFLLGAGLAQVGGALFDGARLVLLCSGMVLHAPGFFYFIFFAF